jgi:hypothetical protein
MIALGLAVGVAAGVGASCVKALARGPVAAALVAAVLMVCAVVWVARGADTGWPFAAFAISFAVTSACGGAVVKRRKRIRANGGASANASHEA